MNMAGIHEKPVSTTTVFRICQSLVVIEDTYSMHMCPQSRGIIQKWRMLEQMVVRMAVGMFGSSRSNRHEALQMMNKRS